MNNKLCTVIGCLGCVIAFFGMGLMFFGVSSAIWGACIGFALTSIGIVGYE